MNIEKEDISVLATIIGFVLMIFGGGRAYEKIGGRIDGVAQRVDDLEGKSPCVQQSTCDERRAGCGRENKLQFDAGEKQFQELKKLIADNDRASNERHAEIMKILLEMNKQ